MEKAYLYHRVPENMVGTHLFPLNSMRESHPDIFSLHVEKYKGREQNMEDVIPTLKCKWNDVIHFSPINPIEIKQALVDAGFVWNIMSFYQIDPYVLDPEKTTIYLYNHKNIDDDLDIKYFSNYNPNEIVCIQKLPERTKKYYKETYKKNEKTLVNAWVPHILYKGSIDVSNLPIITV
ncbi:MAG: hypothetical protein QM526_00525 [Alphaproteobacteria bacterium]|nr:hypothetical protein [Alphaproteobacteria bacterium]